MQGHMGLDKDQRLVYETELARRQAIGYVWGRQDEANDEITAKDQGDAIDFGAAYAEAKRAYLLMQRHWLPNIRDAYRQWLATGKIED